MSYIDYGKQGISTGYGTYTQPTGGFMSVKVTSRSAVYTVYSIWMQPVLSSNGILGGSSFACAYSSNATTLGEPYYAFDNNNSTYAQWKGEGSSLIFYNPNPLNITKMKIYFYSFAYSPISAKIQGSNDNNNWTDLFLFNRTSYNIATVELDLSTNTNYYNYYRIYIVTNASGEGSSWTDINQIIITATQYIPNYDYILTKQDCYVIDYNL